MTPTNQLCAAAGTTPEKLAKRVHLHPRYIASLVNNGKASLERAAQLARILDCDMMIFRRGYKAWAANHSDARLTRPGESVTGASPRPAPQSVQTHTSQRERRGHILKVLLQGGEKQ